jgi:UDP-N-acetylmuramoylalanine--D-glutamate ligase
VLAVVTLPPSGNRLAVELAAVPDPPPVLPATDLGEAVRLARAHAEPGSVMLLSPGAPSYGAFRDFEARGDAFRALVADVEPPAPA